MAQMRTQKLYFWVRWIYPTFLFQVWRCSRLLSSKGWTL